MVTTNSLAGGGVAREGVSYPPPVPPWWREATLRLPCSPVHLLFLNIVF